MIIPQTIDTEILHHNFKVEDEKLEIELDNTWKSCCLTTDKRFLLFGTQFFVMLLIIIFCIVQLVKNNDCDSQRAYSSLLTFIIGVMIPTPRVK
jgi:Sec-independent protein secretion pathway component TatC